MSKLIAAILVIGIVMSALSQHRHQSAPPSSTGRLAVFEAWNTQPGKALTGVKIAFKQTSARGLAEIKVAPKDHERAYRALIMNDLVYRYWMALTDTKGHVKPEYKQNFGNPQVRQALMALDAKKKGL